ncbi:MAG: 4-hydroxy-tetrahydrodipicolinate synthase [Clostridia bacterium]|nr:4-hydroxy-tetrahydrodipicolinate synthase [Clostridia bacterium]
MTNKILPQGSIVALVTPFDEYGRVNLKKIKQLIGWHKANGTKGIVAFGTTGESCTLTNTEKLRILQTALTEANNQLFVFAGSGTSDTFKAVKDSQRFAIEGADGLLVVSPYYLKTNDDGMLKHYLAIAESCVKPIVLYNVPTRTGCEISFEVLQKLKHHKNVLGIKEASKNLDYLTRVSRIIDKDFLLYCGNDDALLPYLSMGASGVISVWANAFPQVVARLVQDWFDGNFSQALSTQQKYQELIDLLFVEPNPIPIKALLNLMGYGVGNPRLPLGEVSPKTQAFIKSQLKKLKEFDL